MHKTLRPLVQSHPGHVVQNLQTRQADSIQRVWITSQVQPIQDLNILAYRQVHLFVSVPVLSFGLWQLSYFGAGFAVAALLPLMVVLLLLFVEPLLTALLQTKRLQPSSAIRIVLTLFLLMMMKIVYGMLLSFLSSSFSSSVCCFCCYCCYHGIMHLSIVVEIIIMSLIGVRIQ